MANGVEVESQGKIKNVPIEINEIDSSVSIVMGDLSYDLILRRYWFEANGVIIDFSKRKIYMVMHQQEGEIINPLGDQICEKNMATSEFAYLTHKISTNPYHEASIQIKSNQGNSAF